MNQYEPPGGLPWGLYALSGSSLLLNAVLVTRWMMAPVPAAQDCAPHEIHQAAAAVAPEPAAIRAEALAEVGEHVAAEPVQEEPLADVDTPAVPAPALPTGARTIKLTVHHSLARTFQDGVPETGPELAAKVARLFVWDLDLRRDLQAGDVVSVVWSGEADNLEIEAARYESKKLGVLEAYRFKAPGDDYASWWTPEGTEVARRLQASPLDDYEQITSLLKDRPRHRGMDFKTPVGTPVTSPKAGSVVRTDWNVANNGNCVEVAFTDGTLARFLHLSDTKVKAGDRVTADMVVGLSGNTGHSTAPHLHYELERNEKVVDPVTYHGVSQRSLSERAGFSELVARLQPSLR